MAVDYKDPATLQVAKVQTSKSVLFHTRYFFKHQNKKRFIIGDHHKIICDALERVMTGELIRLIINIAPRYGKTELAVKSFISHGLALNPSAKFIHLSYSDSLALDNSETIKDLIESEEYQALYPEVKIKKDAKAKDKWYTTAGGGVLARSTAGQVTGFGAGAVDEEDVYDPDLDHPRDDPDKDLSEFVNHIQRPKKAKKLKGGDLLEAKWEFQGAIVIDDAIKPEDADSDVKREAVNQRWDSTIKNRVNSVNTPIVIIMQRVHPMDLVGYVLRDEAEDKDKWEVISLPCIKPDGTSLWPHKHTVEMLRAMEKANDLVFGRQYMQDPKPKSGLLFPIQDLNFYDPEDPLLDKQLSDPDFTYIPADPADEGGDDFASGPAKLIGNKIYITDMIYNTEGTDINEVAFRKMVAKNKAAAVGFEGVLGWVDTAKRVREDLEAHGYEGEFRILKPTQKKHTRITNRAAFIRNHIVFRRDWATRPQYAKFIRNVTAYLKIQETAAANKHDDGPDFLEMVASYYEKNFPHLWQMIG